MDTGKLLHDFIFKVQNPHLWKMSKENELSDLKFSFYHHTALLCEIRHCVSLNKQEAKGTLWSKSFHREWQNAAIWGCHCIKNEQGPSWGQTQHLPPTALPSRIRPPQSMTEQGSASPPPPRQRRSAAVSPTAFVHNTHSCALWQRKPDHVPNHPKQTLNTGKPTGHQPETRRTPRLILEAYFGQGISCYLKKLNCSIRILLNKNSQRQSTRCRVSCICLPVFLLRSKNDVKLQNYWVLTTRAPLEERNERPKWTTLPDSSMCPAQSFLPKIACGLHSSFYHLQSQEVKC